MTTREEREKAIKGLEVLKEVYANIDISEKGDIVECLDYAIDYLKTDCPPQQGSSRQQLWIPIDERLPEVDEDGFSEYVLISCSNFSLPTIGVYHQEADGSGAFCDDEGTLASCGFMVNAWMPLPKNYSEGEEE